MFSPSPRRIRGRLSNATPPVTPAKMRPRAFSQPGAPPAPVHDATSDTPNDHDGSSHAPSHALPLSPPYTPGRRILSPSLSGRTLGLNDLLRSILPSRMFKSKQQQKREDDTDAPVNALLTPDPSPPRQSQDRRECDNGPLSPLDSACSPAFSSPVPCSAQAINLSSAPAASRLLIAERSTSTLGSQNDSHFSTRSISTASSQISTTLSSPVSLLSPQGTRSPTCETVVDLSILPDEPSLSKDLLFSPDVPMTPLLSPASQLSDTDSTPTPLASRPAVRRYGSAYSDHFAPEHILCSKFLEKYKLNGEIGSGGHGFVLTGHARWTPMEIAVKFVMKSKLDPEQWTTDPATGERLPLEAHLLRTLDHPAIIACLDLFEDEKYFYIVLELHGSPWSKHMSPNVAQAQGSPSRFDHYRPIPEELDGEWHEPNPGATLLQLAKREDISCLSIPRPALCTRRPSQDLFECIEHNELSEEQARFVFSQVVDAVAYMHCRGIVHRDIKDENILIDCNLKVKLIDFGSAVQEDPSAPGPLYTLFYGTPNYAASEIMNNQAYRSRPAEIWTLGILLCNLVWGCSPFINDNGCRCGDVQLPRFVPNRRWLSSRTIPECIDLLRRCLHVDPDQRLDIEGVASHPWLKA